MSVVVFGPISRNDQVRRLVRARNWHQMQAARVAEAARVEAQRHDHEVELLTIQLRALGIDPQTTGGDAA